MAALAIQMHSETPRRAPSLRPPPKAMAAGGSYGASDKQRGIKMDYTFYFAPGAGNISRRSLGYSGGSVWLNNFASQN